MKLFIGLLSLILIFSACSKDKFQTKPQVEIKSLSPGQVYKGQFFEFIATIRDKEGDLQDSVLLVKKRYNGSSLLTADTTRLYIAPLAFPDKQQIDFSALFAYGELVDGTIFQNLEQVDRDFAIGIIVRDKAGNKSDYVESGKIVLRKL
ncbi:MAG: hypothetical protein ACM3VS_01870 [Candidatus Dadabacteria bacterium]